MLILEVKKMKKARITAIIFLILILSGCSVQKYGNDLNSFCVRTKIRSEEYAVTAGGFIAENDKFTKYFHIDGHDIMIRFAKDKKNRLTAMDIVLPDTARKSETTLKFCENCIYAFINDEEKAALLGIDGILDCAAAPQPETKTTDADGVGVNVDSLDAGTVITVYFEE